VTWERNMWLIYFEDADMRPELFTSEDSARARLMACRQNWNCHLFVLCDKESESR